MVRINESEGRGRRECGRATPRSALLFALPLVAPLLTAALLAVPAAAAAAAGTLKSPIFRGGASDAWPARVNAERPGQLAVSEVVADVGSVRDIAAEWRSPSAPFGSARRLGWSGEARAQYVFASRSMLGREEAARYRANGFLVFDLKRLAGGSDLRLGNACPRGRGARCAANYRLAPGELGVWHTYRIPLTALGVAPFERQGLERQGLERRGLETQGLETQGGPLPAFVIESHGEPSELLLADVRWEAYPEGQGFAESLARDLLAELTLSEKIGQLAQIVHRAGVDADPVLPQEAAALGVGSLFGDSGTPPHDTNGTLLPDTPGAWLEMLHSYQSAALATDKAIPILFGMDAVHGLALVPGATIFPHNIGLGASSDPELVEAIGRATAREASALGFRLTFSPTIAVARDERWGRTYESFGERPDLVAPFGAALVRGYQHTGRQRGLAPLSEPDSVLACVKHFGGDGAGTFANPEWCTSEPCPRGFSTDRQDNALSEEELIALHLRPYQAAIAAGAGAIMSADSFWQGQVVTGNARLLHDVLRERFGFQGILITDYQSWAVVNPADPEAAMIQTLNAGNDLVMLPTPVEFELLRQAVSDGLAAGTLSAARVDEAVLRILRKKFELGLFDVPFANPAAPERLGSAEHRALARRAVQESLVLLKNEAPHPEGAVPLPIARRSRLYVAGKAADDIGIQSGGWTDVWQGVIGNSLPGSSVLAGLRAASEGEVSYSADASADTAGADLGVVVVGEYPYAEFCGDVLGKTFFCEFSRVNPPGLVRGVADFPLPIGLPPPQSLGLGTSSLEYFTPFTGPDFPIPFSVDPVSDLEVIDRVCARLPCVVVLISGRPMFIEPALARADAFVAAWLPGSEGEGIADVLYGRQGLDFRGRLTHTWPQTPRDPVDPARPSATPELDYVPQNQIVSGNGNLDHVLFPVGYGLRYAP
jgi:beta-glucosidase